MQTDPIIRIYGDVFTNTQLGGTVESNANTAWSWRDCLPDPWGLWSLEDDGIYFTKITARSTQIIRISGQPIYVEDRAVDVDTGLESVTLLWMDGLRVRKYTAPRKELSGSKGIMELANRGYGVNAGNARDLVGYIAHLLDYHQDNIPVRRIVSSCGTKDVDGSRVFMVGAAAVYGDPNGTEVSFDPHADADGIISSLRDRSGGSLASWIEMAQEIGAYPNVAFGVMASFLPPLLKDLEVPQNPIIDFGGVSSTGKTTTLKMCASVWGYPLESDAGLVRSWSGTRVFFERYAAVMNELPIFLDESHRTDPKEAGDVVYQYANGTGRGRGTINGLQKQTKYRGVLFSAGESRLTDVGQTNGIQARVISFWGSPFPSGERSLVSRVNRVSEKHYGLAGRRVLEHYLRHRDELLPELRKSKADMSDRLAEQSVDDIGRRLAALFGAVYAAGKLANSVLELGWDIEAIIEGAFAQISDDRAPNSAEDSIELVGSWIASNQSRFNGKAQGEVYGRIFADREDGQERIGILPHVLQAVLKQHDYAYNSILSQWQDRGWIDTDKGRKTKKVRFGGGFTYMVVLNQAGIEASAGAECEVSDENA